MCGWCASVCVDGVLVCLVDGVLVCLVDGVLVCLVDGVLVCLVYVNCCGDTICNLELLC